MNTDKTDRKLLMLLQNDSKLTTKQLAYHLDLTVTPVFERIRKLEKSGIITKYVALTDKKKLGKLLTVFCNVSLKEHNKEMIREFENQVIHITEVMECHHVAGIHDYLLKVVTDDMDAYHNFVYNKLTAIGNIANVNSSFVMNEIKYTTAHHLDIGF
jgi:DNA-binding Lrp family transcriptional regulator